jgi:hypothetical protein
LAAQLPRFLSSSVLSRFEEMKAISNPENKAEKNSETKMMAMMIKVALEGGSDSIKNRTVGL